MSRITKSIITIAVFVCVVIPVSVSALNVQNTNRHLVLQSGTSLPVRISQEITTRRCKAGDLFRGITAADIVNNGTVIISQGASVQLRVVEANRPHSSRQSRLTLEVVSIELEDGRNVAILSTQVTKYGESRSGSGISAGQLIYSLPGRNNTWRSLASTLANRPTSVSMDVMLEAGHPLQFTLSAPAVVR